MNRVARPSLAVALLAAALFSRTAAASTVVAGGNLGNQTWTPAGSPYIVSGDITVQVGATLTIQAGSDVQFLSGDTQASGVDTNRIELTVAGALAVSGTPASPVTFELQSGQTGSWYGIVIGEGASSASIANASIRGTVRAITSSMTGATLTVTRSTIQSAATAGVQILGGSATLDGLTIGQQGGTNPGYGFQLLNGASAPTNQVKVLNSLVVGCNYGVSIGAGVISVDVSSSTFDRDVFGVYVTGPSSTVTLRSSIVTNSGNAGVSQVGLNASSLAITYSDVWNNATNYSGSVSMGAGVLSANPQYAGTGDYHLLASSVCIDSGTATGAPDHDHDGTARPLDGDGVNGAAFDMGAYEFGTGGGTGGAAGGGGVTGTGGAAGGGGTGAAAGSGGTGGAAGRGGSGGAAGSGAVGGIGGAAGSGAVGGIGGAAGSGGTVGAAGRGGVSGNGGAAGSGAVGGIGGAAGDGGAAGSVAVGGAGGAAAGAGGGIAGASGAAGAAGTSGGTGGARDASADGAPDGGPGPIGDGAKISSGCGCATGGHPTSNWGLGLLAAALLLGRRRSRHREAAGAMVE